MAALALLIRKAEGWTDIGLALQMINELRELQSRGENPYLDAQQDQSAAAYELVGLYHLAQMVVVTGSYLRDGTDSATHVQVRLDRHREQALEIFDGIGVTTLSNLADLVWVGCRKLAHNSIWTHIAGLGERLRDFSRVLASAARANPVVELWPSQQDALRRNLLDPYKRAVLVEMPTSSGKTLLAKFAIVQTNALNPNGVIAYVVPTRALVNQVTVDLRDSFRDLQPRLRVEQAVPAFELDPTEERLLTSKPEVLVTTPEKLDLLVRRDHPVTKDLTLVIADEVHNLRDGSRGARLELLLGTIKRDRGGARFLLLSPFLPNDAELVNWLGDDRAAPPISVHWQPARKVVGIAQLVERGAKKKVILRTVPAADNVDVPAGITVPLGSAPLAKRTISSISRAVTHARVQRGAVLVLCAGPGTAMTRARELAAESSKLAEDPLRETVCRYVEAEMGRSSELVEALRRGVAYHHSGLSHETRWLIESLISHGLVNVVCGTTTLAQGVNFPISTVIVETLTKGDKKLTFQDFWNIAGRAGRALMDRVGVVAFPAPTEQKRQEFELFLQGEALEITSQLTDLLARVDEITANFNMQALRNWPQLSALMQFLAHAVKVSAGQNLASDVEELLRASLVYHQARRTSAAAVRSLLKLCRSYIEHLQGHRGILALADQTGFATPSVLGLMARISQQPDLRSVGEWRPERLFGNDLTPLTKRVEAIATLPEMGLGYSGRPPFNARRVAGILRDWVRGDNLNVLSNRYPMSEGDDPEHRITNFSKYLFSTLLGRASWGLGALETMCVKADDEQWASVGHVPSMVFFGVRRREAVWLRMVGVPRIVADGLANIWVESKHAEPQSYDELRNWVGALSPQQISSAIPANVSLEAGDVTTIWHEFTT